MANSTDPVVWTSRGKSHFGDCMYKLLENGPQKRTGIRGRRIVSEPTVVDVEGEVVSPDVDGSGEPIKYIKERTVLCGNCGQTGHNSRTCVKAKIDRPNRSSKCGICKQKGHAEEECPEKEFRGL